MIIEHIVQGSKNTSFHDFKLSSNGLEITLSGGSYYQAGVELLKSINGVNISIPFSALLAHYEVWLTSTGIQVLVRNEDEEFDNVTDPIDRLLWFTVPANETDLNNVNINFMKVVNPFEG